MMSSFFSFKNKLKFVSLMALAACLISSVVEATQIETLVLKQEISEDILSSPKKVLLFSIHKGDDLYVIMPLNLDDLKNHADHLNTILKKVKIHSKSKKDNENLQISLTESRKEFKEKLRGLTPHTPRVMELEEK